MIDLLVSQKGHDFVSLMGSTCDCNDSNNNKIIRVQCNSIRLIKALRKFYEKLEGTGNCQCDVHLSLTMRNLTHYSSTDILGIYSVG